MENYSNYKTEDFLGDERFRRWMISQGLEEASFWEDFKRKYPEKQNDMILARSIFGSLDGLQIPADKEIKEKIWDNVENSIGVINISGEPSRSTKPLYRWWMVAASILLLAGFTWVIRSTFMHDPLDYKTQVASAKVLLREQINSSAKQQIIRLKDGSTVTLKSGSRLSYSDFSATQRVVYLDGEGYFNVAKDSLKPFIVYAGRIVVQVVGTSFNVLSNSGLTKSNVSVTSGKVKVFAAGNKKGAIQATENGMVYLTPNQQVSFDATTSTFKMGLVSQPVQLVKSGRPREFYYVDTSVNDIIEELETAYGVKIQRDKTAFGSCKVTAPLGNLPLFGKLDIICQTLGATYEVFGTEIIISGGDCTL